MIDNIQDNKVDQGQITEVVNKNGVTLHDTFIDEIRTEQAVKQRPLTGKEREYIKYRIANPTASKAESVRAVYDVKPDVKNNTLRNMATTIEKRPAVHEVLLRHEIEAEETLADVMRVSRDYARTGTKEGASYAGVAEKTANSIIDRLRGKATIKVDQLSTSVNFNIDLTM